MNEKLINIGLLTVGGAALIYFGKKWFDDKKTENTEDKADTPEVQQAMLLRSALNPSGNTWMKDIDGTDTETIFKVAKQITKQKAVSESYRNLYKSSMYDDLSNDLSTSEYQKFLSLMPKK